MVLFLLGMYVSGFIFGWYFLIQGNPNADAMAWVITVFWPLAVICLGISAVHDFMFKR